MVDSVWFGIETDFQSVSKIRKLMENTSWKILSKVFLKHRNVLCWVGRKLQWKSNSGPGLMVAGGWVWVFGYGNSGESYTENFFFLKNSVEWSDFNYNCLYLKCSLW